MLTDNLPSLACTAATEIDDLILGRGHELGAVQQFAEYITERMQPVDAPAGQGQRYFDPRIIIIMQRVISHPVWTTVDELLARVDKITASLKRLCEEPEVVHRSERVKLRAFCLAVSEVAAAYDDKGAKRRAAGS